MIPDVDYLLHKKYEDLSVIVESDNQKDWCNPDLAGSWYYIAANCPAGER